MTEEAQPCSTADLEPWGWDEAWTEVLEGIDPALWRGLVGRVVLELRGELTIHVAQDVLEGGAREIMARISGRLRHHLPPDELPTIGDWVIVRDPAGGDETRILSTLPRRSYLARKAAGRRTDRQIVAANVDTVLIVTGLDGDFNLRRLERFLTMARDGGVRPVAVLNKSDLVDGADDHLRAAEAVAAETPVLVISSLEGRGLEQLDPFLEPRKTLALVGSSGVGKSTLVNALLGREAMATGEVRASDQRGKHTTSHRQAHRLEGGAILIDNPGIRELQLWDDEGALDDTFADVDELAAGCRFRDCTHAQEPGCNVRAAVASGELESTRLEAWQGLAREAESLRSLKDQRAKLERKRKWRAIGKAARKHRPRSFD